MIKINIADYGMISLELDREAAPIAASNFTELARRGFYDGLTFHRVIDGFMIQGGDPDGNGCGGPGYRIKGEFSSNGVKNRLQHRRGVISMARSNNPDSAGSQFFIMHQDAPHLDGQYAAFGKIVSGLDVLDEVARAQTDSADRPTKKIVISSVEVIDEPEAEFEKIRD